MIDPRRWHRRSQGLALMLIGSAFAALGVWLYVESGGTVVSRPESKLYWAPAMIGGGLVTLGAIVHGPIRDLG